MYLKEGFVDYLSKPIDQVELDRILREQLHISDDEGNDSQHEWTNQVSNVGVASVVDSGNTDDVSNGTVMNNNGIQNTSVNNGVNVNGQNSQGGQSELTQAMNQIPPLLVPDNQDISKVPPLLVPDNNIILPQTDGNSTVNQNSDNGQ